MSSDFVSLLLDYTKEYESPSSFWRWSAYSILSSVLRSNVYIKHKKLKIYPNTYILLLADAGKFRKGHPLKIAETLIAALDVTKTFSGTASVQGILDKLSQDIPIKGKGKSLKGGSCLILAEELAAFFVEDPRLIPMLAKMYDFSEHFPYDLRSGSILIKNLCVSMLLASNETFLREVYTQQAIYGGLLRRTLLIKPDETRKGNSLIDPDIVTDDIKDTEDWDKLLSLLREIILLEGEIKLEYTAAKFFHEWYNELYNNYDKYGNKTGWIESIHILILKVSMLLAISEKRMIIEMKDIDEAIFQVTSLKPNYDAYAMSTGRSEKAGISGYILGLFWEAANYNLSKREILFKHWNQVSSEELDKVIETFIASDILSLTPNGNGQLAYTLTKRIIDKLNEKVNLKGKP